VERLYLDKEISIGDTNARIIGLFFLFSKEKEFITGKSHSMIKEKIVVWDESSNVLSYSEPNSVFSLFNTFFNFRKKFSL
jgi:hypothetical protein